MQPLKDIAKHPLQTGYGLLNFMQSGTLTQQQWGRSTQKKIVNNVNINPSKDFEVIDTIRFIAMCFIVWGHCNLGCESATFHTTTDLILQSVILQIGKLGTIIFFLMSGYLIEPKIKNYTPVGYLKLRLKSIILPWLLFVVIFSLLNMADNTSLKAAIYHRDIQQILLIGAQAVKSSIFDFAYWFIVVFLISAVLLIVVKKYIHTVWMGLVLGLITLFYCVNLHYGWISAHHTKAFLGYTFFMWLGMQLSRHYQKFITLLNSISWPVFIGAFVLSLILACYEGFSLSRAGCTDPYASIRLSNIVNSLIVFGCLFKLGKSTLINSLKPRRTVYGVYLLHNVLVYEMISIYSKYFSHRYTVQGLGALMLAEILAFTFILTLSIFLVYAFNGKYVAITSNAFNSLSDKIQQLAHQIAFSATYNRPVPIRAAYRVSKFALLIMLPCLGCFYFFSRFFT